ncbi:MAG: 6-pyruvoyl-tetrahydropterin synthase-related protein [Chloroflexota bacterium]
MTTTIEVLPKDWPDWMRQARQGVDWGIVLIFAFSLTIAMPFLTQNDLPHTNASENYVYRSADYAAALQEGRLYPRWSANVFGGYGAPIPHYFLPGAGYAAAVIQVLFTNDPVLAVRILYALSLGVAGTMVYLLVTRRVNATAGLLAGILYVYSPYVGLTAPQILGDLPVVMSLALMPMLLWSTDRLVIHNKPIDFALVTLTTSALFLTNIQAAMASLFLAIVLLIWHKSTIRQNAHILFILGGFLLGIGIAGFYWIPVLLEENGVHWLIPRLTQDYQLALPSLFSPLLQVDIGEMIHAPQLTIGMSGIGFSIAGVISALRFRARVCFQILFLVCGIILTAFALVLMPHEVWLLGPIALCLSIGGSAVAQFRTQLPTRWKGLFLSSLLILIWIVSSPVWLPPVTHEPFGDTDAVAQVEYEQQGYGVAVVPPNQAIPSTVPDNLAPNRFLFEGYQAGVINKITPSQLNSAIQLGLLDHNTHSDTYQLRTNGPITLDILTAYFPGWKAFLSDHTIPLTLNPETGLMRASVPTTTNNELSIVLGSTPIRTASWIITWDLLLILAVVTWGRLRRSRPIYNENELLSYREIRLAALVLLLCAAIIYAFNDVSLPLSLRMKSGYELQNSTVVQNRTDSGMNLLAFRLDNNRFQPGQTVDLTLFWQAQRSLIENYRVRVHFINNRDGSVWNYTQWHEPGFYPTRRWKSGLYVRDDYHFQLEPDMTPGNYQINVEANLCKLACDSDGLLTFFNINGQVLGTQLTLPTLLAISG